MFSQISSLIPMHFWGIGRKQKTRQFFPIMQRVFTNQNESKCRKYFKSFYSRFLNFFFFLCYVSSQNTLEMYVYGMKISMRDAIFSNVFKQYRTIIRKTFFFLIKSIVNFKIYLYFSSNKVGGAAIKSIKHK